MDRKKIDKLNANVWEVRTHDSLAAKELAEKALTLAEEINYEKGIADANRTKGFCLIRFGENEKALRCIEKAKKIYEELDDQKGLATVYE